MSGPSDGDATTPPVTPTEGCAAGSTPVIVDAAVVFDGAVIDGGKCSGVRDGVERGGNCYWVPQRDPLTWEFANTRCQKPDPKDHISTIGSSGENDFLVATFPTCEDRWIGLNATHLDGGAPQASDFKWKNTAPDAFRAWAPGFPSGEGKCVVVRPDGKWENRPCIEVHTVICERE